MRQNNTMNTPRDMTAEEAWRESGEQQKRKPLRRDAEKRRQQNIQAQRRYRERVRGRLESLEALAASTQQKSLPTTAAAATMETESRPVHDAAPDLSMVALSTATSSDCESLFSPFNLATSQMNMGDSAFPWDTSPSTWEFSHSDTYPSSLNVSDLETELTPPAAAALEMEMDMVFASMHKDGSSSKNAAAAAAVRAAPATVKCACDKPHLQITVYELGADGRLEVSLLPVNIGPAVPATPAALALALAPADLYVNHIRLDSVCTLAAMDTLRMQVGLTEDMMCSEDYPSPFYRPIRASSAQNNNNNNNSSSSSNSNKNNSNNNDPIKRKMVHAVQKTFKALQPDLRPSPEQITVQHPPYIDALPFRQLRKNLILRQDEIDPQEFLCDVVTGLVCWAGAGLGKKDRDTSTGDASTGTPWDNRSWEAKVWFLRKYWSMLGGEEGELVRQSQWWRGIRGEEDSLDIEGDSISRPIHVSAT